MHCTRMVSTVFAFVLAIMSIAFNLTLLSWFDLCFFFVSNLFALGTWFGLPPSLSFGMSTDVVYSCLQLQCKEGHYMATAGPVLSKEPIKSLVVP